MGRRICGESTCSSRKILVNRRPRTSRTQVFLAGSSSRTGSTMWTSLKRRATWSGRRESIHTSWSSLLRLRVQVSLVPLSQAATEDFAFSPVLPIAAFWEGMSNTSLLGSPCCRGHGAVRASLRFRRKTRGIRLLQTLFSRVSSDPA